MIRSITKSIDIPSSPTLLLPILLYNDECRVCRHIADWVSKSAVTKTEEKTLIVQAIGEDPEKITQLCSNLTIWDAYATIHILMPNGSMKLGGEAVAQVLRTLPNTKWFAWSFNVRIFRFRPFQMILDLAYAVLAEVRPIFGCESSGEPKHWMKPFKRSLTWFRDTFGTKEKPRSSPHSL